MGNALRVTECSQVTADHVYEDGKVNGKCYSFTPVQVKGKLYFVLPDTRDLVTISAEVPCIDRHENVFQTKNGDWTTAHGPAKVHTVPVAVKWRYDWEVPTFTSPPIFSPEADEVVNQLGVIRAYLSKTEALHNQVQKLVDVASIDP